MNGFRPPISQHALHSFAVRAFQGMLCLHSPLDAGVWRSCYPLYGWFPLQNVSNFGPVVLKLAFR